MKNECVKVVDEVDDIGGVCIQMTFPTNQPHFAVGEGWKS